MCYGVIVFPWGHSEVNFYKASVNPYFGSTRVAGLKTEWKLFSCHTTVEPNCILVWHSIEAQSLKFCGINLLFCCPISDHMMMLLRILVYKFSSL